MTEDTSSRQSLSDIDIRAVERDAGLNHLSPAWAKAEIVLGLSAAAAGVKLLIADIPLSIAGGALFVLGAYLAMAGNRSHVYQSQNRQTAYLRAAMIDHNRRPAA